MNKKLEKKKDERGELIEVFKFPQQGQIFYVKTRPGITRGNHYHTRKIEQFCVIEGRAELRIRNRNREKMEKYTMNGDAPEIISIPPGHVHNITNIGDSEMLLLVWVNEIFNPKDPDTFNEKI